jgi:hypothetical protein
MAACVTECRTATGGTEQAGAASVGGSVDFFVFAGDEELEEYLGFVAEEVGDDFDAGAADFFHFGIGDGQFVEACGDGVGDGGAVDDFVEVGPVYGGEAHGAGLGGGVDGAAGEIDGVEFFAGEPDGVDFGVGGDVGGLPDDVVCDDDEFVVFDNGGAEGGLSEGEAFFGFFDGEAHPVGVSFGHVVLLGYG